MTTQSYNPANAAFDVITELQWCEERGDFFCTWRKTPRIEREPRSWVRKRNNARFVNNFWENEEMKRYIREKTKQDKKFIKSNDPLLAKLDNLQPLFCDLWWDDGEEREPCSLTVRFGPDKVDVTIVDKANKQSIYTTAANLLEALQELDKAIGEGKHLWRVWKDFNKKGK